MHNKSIVFYHINYAFTILDDPAIQEAEATLDSDEIKTDGHIEFIRQELAKKHNAKSVMIRSISRLADKTVQVQNG